MSENQINTNRLKNSSVMITGGSGLIGRYLTSVLLSEGYTVSHLSRNNSSSGKIAVFNWDPRLNIIDPSIFDGVDYLIHLAGANVGEKRWTANRKSEILSSRIDSANLLFKTVTDNKIPLKAFISASATGYYGALTSEIIRKEQDNPGTDFLASTCRKWEEVAEKFGASGIRTVIIRTGVVLEKNDSALSRLMMPARFGFLVQTGNGHQYMPWIHINDLCNIYLRAIEDDAISGTYNAVSPQHVTHRQFLSTLSRVMNKPVFPLPVPSQILRVVLGGMADVILKGSRVSSDKIEKAGFGFEFTDLEAALRNVINS